MKLKVFLIGPMRWIYFLDLNGVGRESELSERNGRDGKEGERGRKGKWKEIENNVPSTHVEILGTTMTVSPGVI